MDDDRNDEMEDMYDKGYKEGYENGFHDGKKNCINEFERDAKIEKDQKFIWGE